MFAVARLAAVAATCVAVVATTAGPRRDLDYWWHVLLGRALMAGDVSSTAQWAVWPGDPEWRTAQPLAEVMLAAADQWWQPASPATVRALTAAAAMATLAAVCRPGAAGGRAVAASRWWAFGCGAAVVMGFSQERPAQVGLVLMPLAGALAGWWASINRPTRRWWLLLCGATVATGALWSLSHQSWLLAWVVVAVAVTLSPRPLAAKAAFLGLLAALLGWGWLLLGPPWAAITTAGAASSLAEWQPTEFTTIPGLPATAMVLACAASIARAATAPPGAKWLPGDASRYAVLLVLGVVGASAWRHLPVTVLAAGPVLIAHTVAHTGGVYPDSGRRAAPQRAAVTSATAIGLPLVLSVLAAHLWAQVQPAPLTAADHVAAITARHACAWPTSATIATHYNDSGPALAGARAAPCPHSRDMQVVIDGRADRYGADALRRWQQVVDVKGRNWERDWRMVDPDIAVLRHGSALGRELRRQGWHLAEMRHGYEVLHRPPRLT